MTLVSPAVHSRGFISGIPCVCRKARQHSSSALFPAPIELGIGKFIAIDVAADGSAPQIVLVDAFFLVGGHVRNTEANATNTGRPVGQLLVFELDHLLGHAIDKRTS